MLWVVCASVCLFRSPVYSLLRLIEWSRFWHEAYYLVFVWYLLLNFSHESFVISMLRLDTAYLCTKFDHYSSSRSRDVVGAHPNLNGSSDLTRPFQRWLVFHGLALATINLTVCLHPLRTHEKRYKISKMGLFG